MLLSVCGGAFIRVTGLEQHSTYVVDTVCDAGVRIWLASILVIKIVTRPGWHASAGVPIIIRGVIVVSVEVALAWIATGLIGPSSAVVRGVARPALPVAIPCSKRYIVVVRPCELIVAEPNDRREQKRDAKGQVQPCRSDYSIDPMHLCYPSSRDLRQG